MRRRIRIRRIVAAVVGVVAGVTMLAGAFLAGVETGQFNERREQMGPKLQISVWTGGSSRWSVLGDLTKWGVADVSTGDAFAMYWPDGDVAAESPCARSATGTFDGPMWPRQEKVSRESAACDRLDEIVRASHYDDLDFTAWLRHASDAGYGFDDSRAYGVYRRPLTEVSALLARAHWRIEAGDLDGAESDARAVVSSSLLMIRKVPEASGIAFGFMLLGNGLDHLREVSERRNDAASVAAIGDAQLQVASLRATFMSFMRVTGELATLPEASEPIAQFATSQDYPVGMRAHAATLLGYAWVKHPREIVLGPSVERRTTIESLKTRPELALAVSQARQGLDMPMRERVRFAKSYL